MLIPKKYKQPAPHSIWRNPLHFIACGFGIGAIPFFPGTFGTMLGIPIAFILSHHSIFFYGAVCFILFCLGIYLCDITNRDFGTTDHPAAVFDELATFPIVMMGIPFHWYFLLIGFCLFRFFDIVKPWPISWVDNNIHNGFGVMFDDLLAALFSGLLLHAIFFLHT